MYIKTEFNINTFEAWSGGKDTKNTIIEHDKEDEFNSYVEEVFPEGCTDTEMNDFLWLENDYIFEVLDISEEEEDEEEDDKGEYDEEEDEDEDLDKDEI